jgi:hypothetical protein
MKKVDVGPEEKILPSDYDKDGNPITVCRLITSTFRGLLGYVGIQFSDCSEPTITKNDDKKIIPFSEDLQSSTSFKNDAKYQSIHPATPTPPPAELGVGDYELAMLGNADFKLSDPINHTILKNIVAFEQPLPANITEENLRTVISTYMITGKDCTNLVAMLPLRDGDNVLLQHPVTGVWHTIRLEDLEDFNSIKFAGNIPEVKKEQFLDIIYGTD